MSSSVWQQRKQYIFNSNKDVRAKSFNNCQTQNMPYVNENIQCTLKTKKKLRLFLLKMILLLNSGLQPV